MAGRWLDCTTKLRIIRSIHKALAYFFHRIIFSLREGVRLQLGYCVFGQPEIVLSTARKTDRKGEPKISLHARALRAHPAFLVFCLHLFTNRALWSKNQQIECEGFTRFCLHLSFTRFFRKWLPRKGWTNEVKEYGIFSISQSLDFQLTAFSQKVFPSPF